MWCTKVSKLMYGMGIFSLLLHGCKSENATPGEDNAPNIRELEAGEARVLKSSNNFAFNLFSKLSESEGDKNVFISPLSISMALTMTYNGAAAATKEDIRKTLDFELQSAEEINQSYKSLTQLLTSIDKKVTFTPANSIWYRNTIALQPDFTNLNKTYFDAEISGLNFSDATGSKTTINNWVNEKTKGKIKDIVDEVTADHMLFLINALYFKGTWTYAFDKKQTQTGEFHQEKGGTSSVPFMKLSDGKYLLYTDSEKQLIDLPYGNKQFSMTILLPSQKTTTDQVIKNLNIANLNTWLSKADTAKLDLYLPKFKLEYKKTLNEVLTDLGMGRAFTEQADFSTMVKGAQLGDLAISKVVHKTFVDVNEEGTEAAAATSIDVVVTSLPPSVRIDRPFVFLIREKSSGAILFVGKLMNPA